MTMSNYRRLLRGAALLSGLATLVVMAAPADLSPEAIAERIKPVGEVHLAGAQVVEVASGPLNGEQVYTKFCVACHATGALNAPKFGDAAAWGPRKAQGTDTLYLHSINGLNQMPAKGTCATCSDDEIKAAVDHMLSAL